MKKRMIALFLTLAMLVSLAPAVVANDTIPRPTVEEILNEYHEKAFEAEIAGETSAATYSPRSGSPEKTLEQETVDTLNAAGYEAYNVTAENYEAIEAQLQTDFDDMGLDPDGSYIIAISGNDTGNNTASGAGTRAAEPAPDGGGNGPFNYYYNGKTYKMRYITITANENSQLGRTNTIDLFTDHSGDELWDLLNTPITFIGCVCNYLGISSFTSLNYSLLSVFQPNVNIAPNQTVSLSYTGATNWTVRYTQVYDSQENSWRLCGSIEKVTMRYSTTLSYYDRSTDQYEFEINSGTAGTLYSNYYYNGTAIMDQAAIAFENNSRYLNTITSVDYTYNNNVVLRHIRWQESAGYEPA